MKRNKDTERDTDNSNNDLPGYPHYAANEDITQPSNNNGKLDIKDGTIELPELKDIPGQQNIAPAPMGELGDVTASSADEEDIIHGTSLDGDDDMEIIMGTEADVTREDLEALGRWDENMGSGEDTDRNANMGLDNTDEDGEPLNETTGDMATTGADLDVPGSEADDANEAIGEEDEENNYYSLDKNSEESTEGIP